MLIQLMIIQQQSDFDARAVIVFIDKPLGTTLFQKVVYPRGWTIDVPILETDAISIIKLEIVIIL